MSANTETGKAVDQAASAVNEAAGSVGDQIAALRKQVEDLYADRQKYMSQAVDAAEGYAARATDATRVQYEAVTDRVRERPGQSLLIAAGVGYILARILGR
ncbi:DUF883 family protein [Muricoccus vinaceus]|uniref:YqjD family protein n=1 Tax=Muricoccus vinaceus TaxID=424704 RepID=A0ABV6IRR0_9PROT